MATLGPSLFEEALTVGQSGNISRAIDLLWQVVRQTPDLIDAWGNLGYLLQLSGRSEEAVGCLLKVLERHPQDFGARKLLGDCYLALGRERNLERLIANSREPPTTTTPMCRFGWPLWNRLGGDCFAPHLNSPRSFSVASRIRNSWRAWVPRCFAFVPAFREFEPPAGEPTSLISIAIT